MTIIDTDIEEYENTRKSLNAIGIHDVIIDGGCAIPGIVVGDERLMDEVDWSSTGKSKGLGSKIVEYQAKGFATLHFDEEKTLKVPAFLYKEQKVNLINFRILK